MSPWIGPGPDDRHLDDQVVEGARLQPRQHRHLRAAFDLEDAERVGLADHRVGARVLGRDGGQIEIDALVFAPAGRRPRCMQLSMPSARHIDLHELQRVDVVLVPLDHLAVVHRRRLDRHQLVQPVLGQDEAAGMLGQMARQADQLRGPDPGSGAGAGRRG